MSRLTEPVGPRDHLIGRHNAPATLVEYGDYECPFSGRAYFEVAELIRRVGRETLYVYRHFPLTQMHPHSLLAAQAGEAAAAQGRFWPMHSMLFEKQDALEPANLIAYAETLGLSTARFEQDLRTGAHRSKLQTDFRTGVRSGVTGTPTFFLNGLRLDRGWDADTLTAAIHEVIQRQQGAPLRPPPLHAR